MFGFVGEHSSALDAESSSAATPLPRDGEFLLNLLKQGGGGGGGSCTSNAKKKSVISSSNNYNNNSNARMHGDSKQAIACTDWYSDPAIAALVGPPSIFQPPPHPQASEQIKTCDGDHRTWMPSQSPQGSFERGYLRPSLDPYLLSSMPDANHFRPSLGTSSGVLRHQYMPDNQPFGQFGHLPHPTSSSSSLLPPYPSSSPPLPPYPSSSSSSSPFPPHPSSSSSSHHSSSPFPPYPSSSSSSSSSPFPPHPSSSSPLIDHHHRPIPSYPNDYSQTWPLRPPHRQVELDHCLESSINRVDNRWVPSGEGGNPDLCFPSLLHHSIEAISTSRRRPTPPPLPPTSRDQYPIGLPNLGYYPGEHSRREPPPLMGRQGHERSSKDGEFYSGTGHGRDKSPSSSALGQNGSALKRVNNYTSVEDVDRHEEEDGDLLNEVSNSLGDLDIAKASANLSLKQKEDLQNRKPVHQTWRLKQNHVKILPLVDYQSAESSIPLEDCERGMPRYNKNSKPVSGSIPEQSQQEMYGNTTTQRSGQGREKEEGFFTENSDQFDENEQDIKRSIPHSKKLGNADLQQRATRPSLGRLLRKEEGSPWRADSEKLTRQLLTLIESLIPCEDEKKRRRGLLSCLEGIIKWDWPEARLLLFGSCANAFGVSNSDIDICLAIDDESSSKADMVAKLAKVLEANRMQNVQALTHARVPIVKFTDPETGISCDICINNILAVVNTKLLHDYAQIDDRLQQLAFAVKHWAKCRRVNETYRGTLSSYAYVLMCIHFLQQRKPPILPCLQEMEPTYNVRIGDCECAYYDQVNRLKFFGSKNKESLGELLASFFDYWGFRHDYSRTVISVRTGRFLSKMEKDWTRRIGNDRHLICIEDPFETCHDLGRVVDKHSIKILRDEFQRAASIIRSDPNPCGTLFLDPYDANKTD